MNDRQVLSIVNWIERTSLAMNLLAVTSALVFVYRLQDQAKIDKKAVASDFIDTGLCCTARSCTPSMVGVCTQLPAPMAIL